jgi:hypothetical protein
VVVGFVLMGLLLAWLDHRILDAMRRRHLGGVLFNGLVGLTLLQPGGNLLEVIVSAVAAIFAALLYLFIAGRLQPHSADMKPGAEGGTKAFG